MSLEAVGTAEMEQPRPLQKAIGVVGAAQPTAPSGGRVRPATCRTGEDGDIAIARALRDVLAFMSDGRLLIVAGHELDQEVMAFRDDLRRKRYHFHAETCSLPDLRKIYGNDGDHSATERTDADEARNLSPVRQKEVKEIFRSAVKLGASDVHIIGNKADNLCRVLFRVHGLLEPYEVKPGHPYVVDDDVGDGLRSAIYMGMTDVAHPTFKPGQPQDARMAEQFVKELGLYGARVATCPLDKGQLMVCRLLDNKADQDWDLKKLGFLKEQDDIVGGESENKRGIIIVAGETGAGKSTTLQAMMSLLIRAQQGQIHALTLEDPPEYLIEGANQYPIVNSDWVGAIKNAMRLDPDVIMIAEMRDTASAKAAFQAALTGHGVRTTLHANGPFSTLTRLEDLGLDKWLYTDVGLVRALVHQGLVPVLCERCKVKWEDLSRADWMAGVSKSAIARIEKHTNPEKTLYFRNPSGCGSCHKGHVGRTVIARVVKPTRQNMEVFMSKGAAYANEFWIKEEGGITHIEHLKRRLNAGIVDPLIGEHMIGKLDQNYD